MGSPEERALRNENQQLRARIAELERKLGEMADLKAQVGLTEGEQQRRSHLAAIVESSDDGIISKTLDGTIVSWNAGAEKLFGYEAEEMVGRSISQLVPPDRHDEIPQILERLHRGECIKQYETERLRKDNRRIEVSVTISPIRDSAGMVIGAAVVSRDITDRKGAEAKLRASEGRFRAIFEQAAVAIAQTGPDCQWLLLNDRFCETLGYSQAELHEMTFLDITHPDDREASLTAVRQLLAGEISSWSTEKRYIRKNGATVWGRLFISLVRDQHDQPQYFIAVVEDITEQKLIEERLRASEVLLRDAQRLAKVGSWERDLEADTIYWSDEMFRIFGVPKEDGPVGFEGVVSFVHPKDREIILESRKKACSSGEPVDVEYRIIRPDAGVRFVRAIIEGIRNDQDAPDRIVGAFQDVTDQVKARELLRESEERLKNAERLAHVGNWHWDIKANRVTGSEEMFRIFGKPPDFTPTYEQFLRDIIPQDKERIERGIRECLEGKSGYSTEYQIALPNGDLRTIKAITEVARDEEGSPVHMFGACQDITDFKRAQEEAFARQKLETVGTLANGIAHDFNNLLGGVLAQTELALDELAAGSRPEEELRGIRDIAIRGSEIVRELMIYAGKESQDLGPVDISQTVGEIIELLKVSVSKHATLETDLGRHLPAVRANGAQISQIVMNLVRNASEAMGDRDGVIRVTTRLATVGRDSPGEERLAEGNYLKLEVSDTGFGMPPETRARVFEPFFSSKSPGRGLGLAVVHGIVRGLRGTINLVSEPGKGTTFEILLPSSETIAGTARGPTSRAEEPARSSQVATILIVEDEDPLRQATSKMLRKAGFSVIEARDGLAALEEIRAQNSPIDVLFLDVTLPGAPSREVFEEARRLRPEMRVIITSAYSEDMAAASLQGRSEHFIRKPYRLGDLVDLVQQSLL